VISLCISLLYLRSHFVPKRIRISFGAQEWMQRSHVWGKLVIITCIVKKEVVDFGGTLAWLGDQLPFLSTWMLAFGGLDVTYLAPDIIEDTRVSMEDLT
jgi:hypothetical protein